MVLSFRRHSLAGELLVLQLAIVVVVLVAVGAVSLAQSAAEFDQVEGRRVTALAELVAGNPLVRTQLGQPGSGETLAPLVQTTMTESGVTSVTIADRSGKIVSSTDPTLIRTRLPLGDPGVAAGRGWSGKLAVDASPELVAQVPVAGAAPDNLGRQLGTVMIGEASPSIARRCSTGSPRA